MVHTHLRATAPFVVLQLHPLPRLSAPFTRARAPPVVRHHCPLDSTQPDLRRPYQPRPPPAAAPTSLSDPTSPSRPARLFPRALLTSCRGAAKQAVRDRPLPLPAAQGSGRSQPLGVATHPGRSRGEATLIWRRRHEEVEMGRERFLAE
jgi:hypothetical protein